MALNRIQTDGIEDDAITTDKILDGTVGPADIGDGELTNTQINASAAIALTKISGLGTAATLDFGTGANQILQLDGSGNLPALNASALTNLDSADLSGNLPALNGSNLTNLTAANLSGALPAIDGSNLTGVSTDTSAMENNIAILAFKTQSANDLAKFNLVDQVIDEYKDGTGATYSTAGQTGSTATAGYLSTDTLITGLGALTDMGVANFTAGSSGDIDEWTWGSGASSNDLYAYNGANEKGGTTLGASTPIVFGAGEEFEVYWLATTSGTGYGPYVGVAPTTYTGNYNNSNTTDTMATTGAMVVVIGATDALRYNASGSSANVVSADYTGKHCKILRDSSNYLKFYSGDSSADTLRYTSTATHSGAYQFTISQQGGSHTSYPSNLQYKIETEVASTPATGTATSTANTALTAPTTGDIVLLIEEVDGVAATLNTAGNDLRCAISRNGGTGWDYVALENKGLWGTNKKILVANGVPFSNSASGTDMRYKLEWANQAAAVVGTYATGDRTSTITVTNNGSGWSSEAPDNTYVNGIKTTGSSTGWYTTGTPNASGLWIRFEFATTQTLIEARMYKDNAANQTYGVWKWQGSNVAGGASGYVDIGSSFTLGGDDDVTNTSMSGNTIAYKYYQLTGVSGTVSGNQTNTEIEFKTADVTGHQVKVHATSLAWA